MKRTKVQMNGQDMQDYYQTTAVALFGNDSVRSMLRLDDALGVRIYRNYLNRGHEEDEPLSEEWRSFLRKLSGPHGRTILKVYQIKVRSKSS